MLTSGVVFPTGQHHHQGARSDLTYVYFGYRLPLHLAPTSLRRNTTWKFQARHQGFFHSDTKVVIDCDEADTEQAQVKGGECPGAELEVPNLNGIRL